MGRREDINRHHTIRHTYMKPPKHKISFMLMIMLIVAVSMGVSALSSSTVKPTVGSLPPPTREQLFAAASMVARGQRGPELMDDCLLMSKGFAAAEDIDAASYAAMLVNGSEPDSTSDKLITSLAADEAQSEIYRLALKLAHQNRLNQQNN